MTFLSKARPLALLFGAIFSTAASAQTAEITTQTNQEIDSLFTGGQTRLRGVSLTKEEINYGIRLFVEENKVVARRQIDLRHCFRDNRMQMAVPLAIQIDYEALNAYGIKRSERIRYFRGMQVQSSAVMSDLSQSPAFPVMAISGGINQAFIESVGNFAMGLGGIPRANISVFMRPLSVGPGCDDTSYEDLVKKFEEFKQLFLPASREPSARPGYHPI